MTHEKAKKIIRDLVDAGRDGTLVECQDGGENVDIIYSREKGHTEEVMTLAESERRMDIAIRAAWRALVGTPLPGDPVEFINS